MTTEKLNRITAFWPIIPALLIVSGFGMMALARYKIRSICEKYPVEIQMRDFPSCVEYGGPWPQKAIQLPLHPQSTTNQGARQ